VSSSWSTIGVHPETRADKGNIVYVRLQREERWVGTEGSLGVSGVLSGKADYIYGGTCALILTFDHEQC